jgi:hypothetical protein
MTSPKFAVLTVCGLGIGLAAPIPASATLIQEYQSASANFTSLSGAQQTLTFTGFNTSLGTLVSVELSFSTSVSITDQVNNTTGTSQNVGSPTSETATATVTANAGSGATQLSANATLTTPGFSGSVAAGINNVGTASDSDLLSNVASLTSPSTDLTPYIGGTNLITVTVDASGTQGGSVPEFVYTGNAGTADATVTLEYDYTQASPVPEPSSVALLVSGILGFGLIRRRRA